MIHLNRANFLNKFAHNGFHSEGTHYSSISQEFSVTYFKKHYYCSKVSLENLKFRLKSFHGLDPTIFVGVDHVIIKEVNGQLFVYLLSSHSSGRCAAFLHH